MGPACEILLPSALTNASLALIDEYLQAVAEEIATTRKGRNWDVLIDGRAVVITASSARLSRQARWSSV
ncbi:DUF6368 family protein [Lacipirellula parvula]|uniref:DUF6368 family protein n=1 Tax=Lacipirellula parvula TaxID=2650471 RepID=UPI003B84B38A